MTVGWQVPFRAGRTHPLGHTSWMRQRLPSASVRTGPPLIGHERPCAQNGPAAGPSAGSCAHLAHIGPDQAKKIALRIPESPCSGMDRGDRIRTCDLVLPKHPRYQAAPRPESFFVSERRSYLKRPLICSGGTNRRTEHRMVNRRRGCQPMARARLELATLGL